jgi:excisionase family DNA binding protein
VRHVRRLVAERRISYIKWGRYLRFDVDDITAWLAITKVRVSIGAG